MADLSLDELNLPVTTAALPPPPNLDPNNPADMAQINASIQEQALTGPTQIPSQENLQKVLSTVSPSAPSPTPGSTNTPNTQTADTGTAGGNYGAQNGSASGFPPMQKNTVSSETSQKGGGATYDPNDETNLGKAYIQSTDANNKAAAAQINLNSEQNKLAKVSADEYNKITARQQENESNRQAEVKTKFESLEKLTDDLNNNSTIDPNRIFANMNTGSKIMAGIGLVLGALGQAKGAPGSSNMGMDALNAAIDRDIDAQKATFNNKAKTVESQRQGFNQYMAVLGDERSAELAEKNRQLDYAKQQMDLVMSNPQYQNPIIQAKAAAFNADLNLKQQQYNLEIHKRTYENSGTTKTAVMDTTENALKMKSLNIDPATGYEGSAPNEKTANDFREAATVVQSTNHSLDRLNTLAKKYSWVELQADPALKGEVLTLTNELKAQLVSSAMGVNRVTQQEMAASEQASGNPLDLLTRNGAITAKLQALKTMQNYRLDTQARNVGLRKVGPAFNTTIKKSS